MSICDEFCSKCIYRSLVHGTMPCCNYLLRTGNIRPCPAGDGCTVRITQMAYRKRQLTPEEIEARKERKRAQLREAQRRYYAKNREKIIESKQKYRQKNLAKIREYEKMYSRERRKRKKEE